MTSIIDSEGEGLTGLAFQTCDIGRLKKELSEKEVSTEKIVFGNGFDALLVARLEGCLAVNPTMQLRLLR